MLIFEQLQQMVALGASTFWFETAAERFRHPVNYFNKWKYHIKHRDSQKKH